MQYSQCCLAYVLEKGLKKEEEEKQPINVCVLLDTTFTPAKRSGRSWPSFLTTVYSLKCVASISTIRRPSQVLATSPLFSARLDKRETYSYV